MPHRQTPWRPASKSTAALVSVWRLTHGYRRPCKRPATPLRGWNKPDTTGGRRNCSKKQASPQALYFSLKKRKRSSSIRGKWHHCSVPDDRAMRCGCLNSDITAGSQSPIQHRRRRGQGAKAVGPGRGHITTRHKTPQEKMQWKQEFVCPLPRGGGVGLIVSASEELQLKVRRHMFPMETIPLTPIGQHCSLSGEGVPDIALQLGKMEGCQYFYTNSVQFSSV